MFKLYDFKKNGEIITTIREQSLQAAGAKLLEQTGIDYQTVGLHIRQCPEELKRLIEQRNRG